LLNIGYLSGAGQKERRIILQIFLPAGNEAYNFT